MAGQLKAAQRVLIVEDSPDIGRLVAILLNESGYLCDVANSAKLAIERLQDHQYNLAIVDLHMQEGDGKRIIRSIDKFHIGLKVIVISGFVDETDLILLNESNCVVGIEIKPVRPEVLLFSVETAMIGQGPTSSQSDLDKMRGSS
ncbi:response regulator [bacterium AH-315-F18]|nr:response regulator [bacterium AH-315-F18]